MAGRVFVIPERPLLCFMHSRCESNEESPESQWLFGAGLGAAAVRLPHFAPNVLPAENTAKLIRSRKNALTPRRRLRSPSPPFSAFPRPFVLRRDRHKKTRKPEVNQQSPITTRHPRTHEWRSRPTAEQERNIPQAVLFGAQAANSRRDRTQDIPIETHNRHKTNEKHSERNAWQA